MVICIGLLRRHDLLVVLHDIQGHVCFCWIIAALMRHLSAHQLSNLVRLLTAWKQFGPRCVKQPPRTSHVAM